MKCPRCKEGVDAGLSHCPYCRVELMTAYEQRAFEVQVKEAAERRKREAAPIRKRKARKTAWAALAAGFTAAVFFAGLVLSRPKPLTVTPPPGWSAQSTPPSTGTWNPLIRVTDGLSIIDIFEAYSSVDASAAATQSFDDPKARVESNRVIVVGGVESIAFTIAGGRAILPSAAAGTTRGGSVPAPKFESQELHGELIIVPARRRTIVIRGITGAGNSAGLRRALDALCAGLRL